MEREASRVAIPSAADRSLLDEVERAQRRGAAVEALLLRLSLLPPHEARPHHRRVAYALLDEASLCQGGQMFATRNGDLVLLGPRAGASQALLTQLFGAAGNIVQVLMPGKALLSYARERAAEVLPTVRAPESIAASDLDAAEALIRGTLPGDLLQCQVAAELLPGGALRPLFREASARLATLAARLSSADGRPATLTPFQDLAAELNARVLAIACDDLSGNGAISGGQGDLALHLNLTVATIAAPGFERFAASVRARGGRAGIELALAEACADPPGFARTRDRLRACGFAVVLDGVGHQTLLFTHPARLGADLVKVEWSEALASETAAAAIREIGPGRVVLDRADDESALRWGYALGIRRFQGRHMDAMLAAARLGRCAFASGCTPRLCAERASASGPAGRAGCRNADLLDAAA
jgi:EAL domain-containing protein (putative c-di-GMP-specific phosphodiesterase class I)